MSVLLVSCGGGGSSGGNNSGGNPPPTSSPAPADPTAPLTVTAENAILGATLVASSSEALLQVVIATANKAIALRNAQSGLTGDVACGSGSYSTTLSDLDGSGDLSAGDRFSVVYAGECSDSVLNGRVLAGELTLTFQEARLEAGGDYFLQGRLSIPSPLQVRVQDEDGFDPESQDLDVVMTGSVDFLLLDRAGDETEIVQIDAGSSPVTFVFDGTLTGNQREVLRGVALRREHQAIGGSTQYTFDVSGRWESELLGGRIDCTTQPVFASEIRRAPAVGSLSCVGAASSALELRVSGDAFDPDVDAYFHPGDGAFVLVPPSADAFAKWFEYIEGALYLEFLLSADQTPGGGGLPAAPIAAQLPVSVVDMAYDRTRDRLYVANASGLLVLDATTLATVDSVAVPGILHRIALSDDDARLWLAYANRNELQALLTGSLTLEAAVPLGAPPMYIGTERLAQDLAVAPGASETVVATMTNDQEVVAYSGGAELPNNVEITGRVSRLAFRNAASLVAMDDVSTGSDVLRIDFDPSTGLTLDETLPGLGGGFDSGLNVGSSDVITDNGVVFNEIAPYKRGSFPTINDGFIYHLLVDPGARRVYSATADVFHIHQEDSYAIVGAYALALSDTAVEIALTPTAVVLATAAEIVRMELVDLQDNQPVGCTREDLSAIEGSLIRLRCGFEAAVYDPIQNLIYAALSAEGSGAAGNSVAVIDPLTEDVVDTIPLWGDLRRLIVSADGTRLYATAVGSTLAADVELMTRSVQSPVDGGYRRFPGGALFEPYQPVAIGVSPTDPERLVVSTGSRDLLLFDNGTALGDPESGVNRDYTDIFMRSDGLQALAYGFNNSEVFDVGVDSITLAGQGLSLLEGSAVQRGDLVFSNRGQVIDLNGLMGSGSCFTPADFASEHVVAVGPDGERVYYATLVGSTLTIRGCVLASATTLDPLSIVEIGGSGSPLLGMVAAGPGRLAIVFENRMLFLDAPDG